MPVLLTLLSLAGAVLAFLFVLAPLRLRSESSLEVAPYPGKTAEMAGAGSRKELLERREGALAALAELDFDLSIGNISEADYQRLRAQYRTQAIEVLQALDEAGPPRNADAVPSLRRRASSLDARSQPEAARAVQVDARGGTGAPVSRRAAMLVGGVLAAALLAIGLGTVALRAGAPQIAEDAPVLPVVHTHAAFLVPGTQVALVGHHEGVLRSTDGGLTWGSAPDVEGDVLAVTGTPDGSALYLATPAQIMRSTDSGMSWQPIPHPRPDAEVNALAVGEREAETEGDPLPLFANVEGAGVYLTTDEANWELVGGGLPAELSALVWRPGAMSALYAAGPRDGVLASGDNGKTWGSASGVLNGVLPTLAVRALAVDPQSGDRFTTADGMQLSGAMYAGTDRGLFKSIDGGSSWNLLPLREPLSAVSARSTPDPLILAVDSRGRVWRSSDSGATWRVGEADSAVSMGSLEP